MQISRTFLNLGSQVLQRTAAKPDFKVHGLKKPETAKKFVQNSVLFFKNIKKSNFENAQEYLENAKIRFDEKKLQNEGNLCLDLDKLDGIQDGIEVFDGLRMKDLAFVVAKLKAFALNRGCHNGCVHCCAEAKPPIRENADFINKMSWEDFKSLTGGFKTLNSRLGFNIFNISNRERFIPTLFYDSDCANLYLKDKDGKIHDFIELNEILYEITDIPGLFDTAGWNIQDKNVQERMEKYAEYYKNPKNKEKIYNFNISANPFHAIYARYVEYLKNGNEKSAEKFRKLYVERMANVLFTLSPIISNYRINFIDRALPDFAENAKGFCVADLKRLYNEIFDKLEDLYKEDSMNGQKIVKDDNDIRHFLQYYRNGLKDITTDILYAGRFEIFTQKTGQKFKFSPESPYRGIIDVNGRFYLSNSYKTYPSKIQFNFENKNKETAPMGPGLQEEVISRAVIDTEF